LIKIGLDLDNTIIDYKFALQKLLENELSISFPLEKIKKEVVKSIIIGKQGEKKWTEMQGLLYSEYLQFAKPFPFAIEAIEYLKNREYELYIISHKTKFPIIGAKVDLIEQSRIWINNNLKSDGSQQLFGENQVYFKQTILEKKDEILKQKIKIFVDDLKEVLELLPPSIKKIWFVQNSVHSEYIIAKDWKEVLKIICK